MYLLNEFSSDVKVLYQNLAGNQSLIKDKIKFEDKISLATIRVFGLLSEMLGASLFMTSLYYWRSKKTMLILQSFAFTSFMMGYGVVSEGKKLKELHLEPASQQSQTNWLKRKLIVEVRAYAVIEGGVTGVIAAAITGISIGLFFRIWHFK